MAYKYVTKVLEVNSGVRAESVSTPVTTYYQVFGIACPAELQFDPGPLC